jgi:hypothetical protein
VSYRAVVDREVGDGLYRLPHGLNRQCFCYHELEDSLWAILSGQTGSKTDRDRKALFDDHLAAHEGAFVCDRMGDMLGTTDES